MPARSPAQHMPESYASKLRRARARRAMHGERRVITMLFCDVTGSSAIAEQLDPEEWAEIMNLAFEFMINPIYKYEGTVARLMGDAILAFFGAPIAHEDDPQRAILAGLEIVSGISTFRKEIKRDFGLDFDVRVGINTGQVVVGDVGSDLALEYTAMGDAINLASRMESSAEPGTVHISEYTYRLIAPLFDVEDRGLMQVEGRSEPVHTYTVSDLKPDPGRLRGIQGVESPLVGRSAEFGALQQIVQELLAEGRSRIVFLVGKAGLGKSRLLDELYRLWQSDHPAAEGGANHWARMDAVSYGASQPYGMIKHLFRSRYHINETDPPEVIREKLKGAGRVYPQPARARIMQLYTILLGAAVDDEGLHPEGEAFKRELFEQFYNASELQIGGTPTAFVADDLQWGDPVSIEQIETLFPLVHDHPVLLVAAMRPERESPAWAAKARTAARFPDHFLEITLDPLDKGESAFLIDNLLAVAGLPPQLPILIEQKSDGNPFFIEEVVRGLLESGAVTRRGGAFHWTSAADPADFAIPGSIQALLVARLDRLEKSLKHTLQLAAVIGPTFYERVLAFIADEDVPLDEHLQELQEKQFIRRTENEADREYAFRHALTQEAVYGTILHRQRRHYHTLSGEAIETLFPQRLEEEAHRLGYHYREGRQWEKALTYYTMAADHAARLYANAEAAGLYEQALQLARQVGDEGAIIALYRRRGRAFEVSGQFADALANYAGLQRLAEESGNERFLLHYLLGKAHIHSSYTALSDPAAGREAAEEALALAKRLGDFQSQSQAYWILMRLDTFIGAEPDLAIASGEAAAAIARRHDLRRELAYALHDLARPYLAASRIAEAQAALEEAGQLWRELGNRPLLADNLSTLAAGYGYQGQLGKGIALAQEALAISKGIGNTWGQSYSLSTLARLLLENGRFEAALQAWQEAIPLAQQANFAGTQVFSNLFGALTYGYLGDIRRARASIAAAAALTEALHQPPIKLLVRLGQARVELFAGGHELSERLLAEPLDIFSLLQTEPAAYTIYLTLLSLVGLHNEQYERVLSALDEGLATLAQMGLLLNQLDLQQLKGETLRRLDRLAESEQILLEARVNALAYGARRALLPVLTTLALVYSTQEKPQQTATAHEEARALAAELAAQISDEDLRQSFLATSAVQTDI